MEGLEEGGGLLWGVCCGGFVVEGGGGGRRGLEVKTMWFLCLFCIYFFVCTGENVFF